MMAELSPDGKRVATIQGFGRGQLLDFQIRVLDLDSKRARLLGKPERIGAPFSWLPDGDGLVLRGAGLGRDDLEDAEVLRPQAERLERRREAVADALAVPGQQEPEGAGERFWWGLVEAHVDFLTLYVARTVCGTNV